MARRGGGKPRVYSMGCITHRPTFTGGTMLAQTIRNLLLGDPRLCGATRHTGWRALRKLWIAENSSCAGCGVITGLEAHHIIPFHIRPDLEMLWSNLVTLCDDGANGCHYRLGHALNWKGYNPAVITDAARFLKRVHESRNLANQRPL